MSERPLRIAYLCDISPLDRNLYSGGNARMYEALRAHAGEVTILSNSWHLAEPLRRLMHMLPEALNLRMRWRLHLLLRRVIARGVRADVACGGFDAVFCAYSFQSLAGLKSPESVVTVFTSDATPTIYKQSDIGQSFGSFLSMSRYFDPWVADREQEVLRSIDLLLWPSEWLRDGVAGQYGIEHDRMQVIAWGANVDFVSPPKEAISISADAPVELLFVGRDWFAKGGPLARDVLNVLKSRGFQVRLTVVGTVPPDEHLEPEMNIIPQLDKSDAQDMERFEDLFRRSHFLINPSFESYGFAYCEASAYGLPSLSLRVGGVPVRDGVNGHALPVGATPSDFADVISTYADTPDAYQALRSSARREYEERLNWDAWGKRVSEQLKRAVTDRRARLSDQ